MFHLDEQHKVFSLQMLAHTVNHRSESPFFVLRVRHLRGDIIFTMSHCSPWPSPFGVCCFGANLVECGTSTKPTDVIKVPTKMLRRQRPSTMSINTTSLKSSCVFRIQVRAKRKRFKV